MHLHRLALENFRNVALARLEFEGPRQFFIGANGQGKTSLLEAAGFVTALRSFRAAETRHLIRHGQNAARVVCACTHERWGESELEVTLRPGSKEVLLDGQRVRRLAEVIGRFPTVAFTSQDQQLIRGSPGGRRRWLDLTLAATDAAYLGALQGYHAALAGRNALLKREGGSDQLLAFEQPLAEHAAGLVAARRRGLEALAGEVTAAYAVMADGSEAVGLAYAPDGADEAVEAWRARWERDQARDRQARATTAGPHRDDFAFSLAGRPAAVVASEGQQRCLVLALRLAQAAWFRRHLGAEPVLLADDVLGDLDPVRRQRFWSAVPATTQVLATGTSRPEGDETPWQSWRVEQGEFGLLP